MHTLVSLLGFAHIAQTCITNTCYIVELEYCVCVYISCICMHMSICVLLPVAKAVHVFVYLSFHMCICVCVCQFTYVCWGVYEPGVNVPWQV